jgi:hypothetical protein
MEQCVEDQLDGNIDGDPDMCSVDERIWRRVCHQHWLGWGALRQLLDGLFHLQVGLEGLSRSAAYLLADGGIRCNVIQPGFIETHMTQGMAANPVAKKFAKSALNNQVLLRRAGKAEEIGYTALFLASDESSYITGTDIVVDGGWFSAAAYLTNERSHHMLDLLKTKDKVEEAWEEFKGHFS